MILILSLLAYKNVSSRKRHYTVVLYPHTLNILIYHINSPTFLQGDTLLCVDINQELHQIVLHVFSRHGIVRMYNTKFPIQTESIMVYISIECFDNKHD